MADYEWTLDVLDDATLYFCPCLSIGGRKTWVRVWIGIRTFASFPAVYKLQDIWSWQISLSGKVIFSISIEISTQTTNVSLSKNNKAQMLRYK